MIDIEMELQIVGLIKTNYLRVSKLNLNLSA